MARQTLGAFMDLIGAIDDAMVQADTARKGIARKRVSHTAFDIGKCSRELFYKWTVPGEALADTDAGGLWIMRHGDAIEAEVVRQLSQAGIMHTAGQWGEHLFPPMTYPVRWKTDFQFVDEDGVLAVADVKSAYGRAASEAKRTGRPKDQYVEQLAFYMGALKYPRGYLVYVARDSSYRTQFRFDVVDGQLMGPWGQTGVSFGAQLNKLTALELAIADDAIPDRPYVMAIKGGELRRDGFQKERMRYKGDWQCGYCPYREKCWAPELERLNGADNAAELVAAGLPGVPVKDYKPKGKAAA